MELLILVIAGFSAGFVDSVAGGGGLISLPMLLAMGLPPKLALGTNKVVGISASLSSTIRYAFNGSIQWRQIWSMGLLAGLASAGGALGATKLDPDLLRNLILFGLLGAATYFLLRRQTGLEPGKWKLTHPVWMAAVGIVWGFYDGIFGPGTGTFLMLSFILLFGRELLQASANSRFVNFCTNLGAILLFSSTGYVDFRLALPAGMAAVAGALTGATWSIKKGSKAIRPVFMGVVWLLILKLAYDLYVR